METLDIVKKNCSLNFNNFLKNIDYNELNKFVKLIKKHKNNNIYLTGIGKSGNVAQHISDIFKSISLSCHYIKTVNITHGDLGMIKDNDLLIMFTNSGNTPELLRIIDLIKCNKALITCNLKGKLTHYIKNIFIVPYTNECDLEFKLIPTNSVVNMIMYFNIIINLYIKDVEFSLDEYKLNHPSGNIGNMIKPISEYIYKDIYVHSKLDVTIEECVNMLNKKCIGILIFIQKINNKNIFYGIVTTKDLLKLYNNNIDKKDSVEKYINTTPVLINNPSIKIKDILPFLKKYHFFKHIPVLNNNNEFIGLLDNSRLIEMNYEK